MNFEVGKRKEREKNFDENPLKKTKHTLLVEEKESNDMTKDNFSPLDDVIHVIEA
jgi:hypothetical protein